MKTTTALWLACAALACNSVACDPESGEGDDDSPGETCSSEGTGTVVIDVRGLPAGVNANVSVYAEAGSDRTITASTTLEATEAGNYAVNPIANVLAPDPVVRTVYTAYFVSPPMHHER